MRLQAILCLRAIYVFAVAAVCAIFAAVWTSASDASVHVAAVPTVRCPTEFAAAGASQPTPATVTIRSSSPTGDLAAYTNTEFYLVGPRGMLCAGNVAADGGSGVTAWPPGDRRPGPHAHTSGLTLSLEPACVSCKAGLACPFFTALARGLGFPCSEGIPVAERVSRIGSNVALFEDPPGVAGSGWPSGGPEPANGVVGYGGSAQNGAVYRATCTLPASDHSICTTIVNDVISRYR